MKCVIWHKNMKKIYIYIYIRQMDHMKINFDWEEPSQFIMQKIDNNENK